MYYSITFATKKLLPTGRQGLGGGVVRGNE